MHLATALDKEVFDQQNSLRSDPASYIGALIERIPPVRRSSLPRQQETEYRPWVRGRPRGSVGHWRSCILSWGDWGMQRAR